MFWLIPCEIARAEMPALDGLLSAPSCRQEVCLWVWEEEGLGLGCMGECCRAHGIVRTDRSGHDPIHIDELPTALLGPPILGNGGYDPHQVRLWFRSDRRFEELSRRWLVNRNAQSEAWDPGFEPTAWVRTVWVLRPDDEPTRIEAEVLSSDWANPGRVEALARQLQQPPLQLDLAPIEPPGAAEAREACRREPGVPILGYWCGDAGCVWIVGTSWAGRGSVSCIAARVAGAWSIWSIDTGTFGYVGFDAEKVCMVDADGGVYSGHGDQVCLSLVQPGRMAFVDPAGLHIESGERYPLRTFDAAADAWARTPLVDADTAAHVWFGLDRWGGPKDASMAWQAARVGGDLVLRVEVRDDRFEVEGRPVNTDHVEIDAWGPSPSRGPDTHIRLALLLGPDQRVAVRAWQLDGAEVDAPFPGAGSWQRTPAGYSLSVAVPWDEVTRPLDATAVLRLGVMASDADDGRQRTLIGTIGAARSWEQWPPTFAEYRRVAKERLRLPGR